jgi:hypothetical protein
VGRAGPKTPFEDRVSDPDSTMGALEDPMCSPLSRIASPMGQGNCHALPGSGTALRCAGLLRQRRAAAGPQRQCPIVRRSPDKMTGNDRALRPGLRHADQAHIVLFGDRCTYSTGQILDVLAAPRRRHRVPRFGHGAHSIDAAIGGVEASMSLLPSYRLVAIRTSLLSGWRDCCAA